MTSGHSRRLRRAVEELRGAGARVLAAAEELRASARARSGFEGLRGDPVHGGPQLERRIGAAVDRQLQARLRLDLALEDLTAAERRADLVLSAAQDAGIVVSLIDPPWSDAFDGAAISRLKAREAHDALRGHKVGKAAAEGGRARVHKGPDGPALRRERDEILTRNPYLSPTRACEIVAAHHGISRRTVQNRIKAAPLH